MALIDMLLQVATHPAVMPVWTQQLMRPAGPPPDAFERLQQRLDAIYAQVQQRAADAPAPGLPGPGGSPALPPPDLRATRDEVVRIAATLKEALRFAREDGMQHPEVIQRVQDAQQWLQQLPAVERYDLAPERVQALPDAERQTWEATLPTLRRLRQVGLNRLGAVPGLEEAAALAGTAAVQLQTGAAVAAAQATPGEPAYSRYAPDMAVDTACAACGRAHLHAVAAALERAAQEAGAKGWTHPDVQGRVAFAQEELAALLQYDWTPEKIAASPPADRQAVAAAHPATTQLLAQVRGLGSPDQLQQAARQARDLVTRYEAALTPSAAPVFHHVVDTLHPGANAVARDRLDRLGVAYTAVDPGLGEVARLTLAEEVRQTAAPFDAVRAAIEACGVPVRVRELPQQTQHGTHTIEEGNYAPQEHRIHLAPFVLERDAYSLQTLLHESSHALLNNPTCDPNPPADHTLAEQVVDDVTILTLTRAGLPIMTRDGAVAIPQGTQVNWDALAAEYGGPESPIYRDVVWASDWLLQALQGQRPVCQTCPVPGWDTPQGGR